MPRPRGSIGPGHVHTSLAGTWFGLGDSIRGDDPDALLVFQVDPATAFGFSKGTHFSGSIVAFGFRIGQTTWRFE